MAASTKGKAMARLAKEVKMVQETSPPGVIDMFVNESDMHSLLFAIAGPEDTSFAGGVYVLKCAQHTFQPGMQIQLPQDYPYSPPDFIMLTPNGRFQAGAKICTSFSSFHPETWSPAYTLTTLLLSFISFFTDEDSPAQGMVHMSVGQRKELAARSVTWGAKSPHRSHLKIFSHLSPGLQTQRSLDAAVAKLKGLPLATAAATASAACMGTPASHEMAAAASVPRQGRPTVHVDLAGVPAPGIKAAGRSTGHQSIDLTSAPPLALHGGAGAIKRARAAARSQAAGGIADGAGIAKVAKVAADVVDLT